VKTYAPPVYNDDLRARLLSCSVLAERYSDAAIERVAAIPVIRPESAMRRVFFNANVRPARCR